MRNSQSWWRKSLLSAAGPAGAGLIGAALLLFATAAGAQGYGNQGYGGGNPQGYGNQGYGGGNPQGHSDRSQRCQDLERQLVSDWQLSNRPSDALAGIDRQLGEYDKAMRRAEGEATQRNCYEDMFLFGRSLRRTPQCVRLDEEIESARRNIANLRQQRDALNSNANRRMRRDDLVGELARYGCGDNYSREYDSRRRQQSIFSLWEDNESSFDRRDANPLPDQSNLPFASYRTMCVRLCDGYYFPISFSTLESRFRDDETKCKEQCAAPAELYIYRNPGEEVENMVSLDRKPYTSLKTAFLNRKHYIKGCSCKAEEYSPQDIAQAEQALGKQASSKAAGAPPADRGGANSSEDPQGAGAKGAGKPQ